MAKKKIDKKDIGKLLSQWNQKFAILVPSKDANDTRMAPWDGEDASFLDWYRNTTISARAAFHTNMAKSRSSVTTTEPVDHCTGSIQRSFKYRLIRR